jgi:hypothetical protein
MPNEPLALPDILAELPDAADYDAVCAALMATERGRWFLTEYASRNRNADTDRLVGAIARVEAAVRGEPAPPSEAAVSPGGPIETAASETQLAAVLAAIERIQDIAFVLHERAIEATLCDTLDAAIREIAAAFVRPEKSAALVAETTPGIADEDAELFASNGNTDPLPRGTHSAAGEGDDESFAKAVAALADSLLTLAAAPEAAPDVPAPSTEPITPPTELEEELLQQPPAEAEDAEIAAAPAAEPVTTDNVVASSAPAESAAVPASSSEDILNFAFSIGPVASSDSSGMEPSSEEPPSEVLLPSQNYATEATVGPQEDPDDLFEPSSQSAAVAAAPVDAASGDVVHALADAQPPAQQQQRAAAPTPRAIPRPAASDPFAAVRALSEEELIALFS